VSTWRRVRDVVAVVVAWARGRSRRTWVIAAVGLLVAAGVPVVLLVVRGSQPQPIRLPRPVAGGHASESAFGASPSVGASPSAPVVPIPSGPPAQRSSTSSTPDFRGSSLVVSLRDPADTSAITGRGGTVKQDITGTGFLLVRTAGDPSALVARLQTDPAVVSASLDYGRQTSAVPSDPFYGQYQQAYMSTIRMPQAWDRLTDASSQIVAVVDTGVDTTHPDLSGRTVAGYNVVDPGSAPTDTAGHGTFVAGEIASNTNNGTGTAGVIWNGRVMPVKVFAGATAFDSDVATGIVWAVDHGARVINLSLGGPQPSALLHAAVQYAVNRDVVVVVAAGNTGDNTPQYPAAFPEVIAVGATDPAGKLVDFSTYGDWLDVAAPGFDITSTWPGGDYATGAGTSFAAPIVSGIAALVRAQNPALTQAQVGDRLRTSARDAGPRGIDPYYGYGVIDAARALGVPLAADFPLALGTGEPNDVPARATPITPGTPISATFGVEGDVDWYRLDSGSAQVLTVTVQTPVYDGASGQNADPVLEIYNPNLARIAQSDSPDPKANETASVAVRPGPTYIKVSSHNGAADTDPYTLTASTGAASEYTSTQLSMPTQPNAVVVGDVTGDGRSDLLYSTTSSWSGAPTSSDDNKLFLRKQQPDGTLAAPTLIYSGEITSLALLDVDQDGRTDVVGTNGLVVWFRQNESGQLVFQGELMSIGDSTQYVVTGDVNGDGRTDLAVLGLNSNSSLPLLLHGAGSSFTLSSIPNASPAHNPINFALGDTNGDGWADLVYGCGASICVFRNSPGGWTLTSYPGTAPLGILMYVTIADVTHDGRNDILATGLHADINVFRQKTDGSLGAATSPYSANSSAETIGVGDVNGDGLPDVAVFAHGGTVQILTQKSDGTLNTTPVNLSVGYSQSFGGQSLAVGDLDGDGVAEMVGIADMGLGFIHHGVGVAPVDVQGLVTSVTPVEYSTGIALTTSPQVVFAGDVDASTINASTVTLIDGRTGVPVPGGVSYDAGSRTATITPAQQLRRATPYRIVVNGVQVSSGLATTAFTSTFTTTSSGPLGGLQDFAVRGELGAAASVVGVVPVGDAGDLIVRYGAGTTPPASPTAGLAGYQGAAGGVMISGLTPGQTYSFAVWYRDQNGNLSPARTATLIGTTLTAAAATPVDGPGVTRTSFTGTVSVQGGSPSGVAVPMVAYCIGHVAVRFPAATATADASGGISVTMSTGGARCVYRWEITDSTQYMGAATASVRAGGAGLNPPPDQAPPTRGH
jgi:type VII secretion-associated serine protease mycosin